MFKKKFNLEGKNILVLGGFGLIGYSAVYGMLDLGAKVLILDKKFDKKKFKILKKKFEKKILFKKFDLSKNKISEFKKFQKIVLSMLIALTQKILLGIKITSLGLIQVLLIVILKIV